MIRVSSDPPNWEFSHRKGDRLSYLRPIEIVCKSAYTEHSKSESFRSLKVKGPRSVLDDLRLGKSVVFWMELPPSSNRKMANKPILIIVTPGSQFGTLKETLLVSVVGKGSALVRPLIDQRIANLVLSGIPARLAKPLMNELHRILKD